MKYVWILLLPLFISLSCQNNSSGDELIYNDKTAVEESAYALDMPAFRTEAVTSQEPPTLEFEMAKKVIKNGRIEFQSESVEKDYQKLLKTLQDFDAYVESSNQSKTDYRITYNLTVRVPAEKYDSVYGNISTISDRLVSKSSNIEDVTERYYDLKTRIKNKKALEARYLEILENAKAVRDVLDIEEKLNQVRTDIERLEGQFRYLSKRVSLSTIHVSFFEVLPYAQDYLKRPGFGNRILNALGQGWEGFLSFLVWSIGLWPFIIILAGLIYLIKRIRRRRQ